MENELTFNIDIVSRPEKIWNTLTDPARVAKYLFNYQVETDWQPGNTISYFLPLGETKILTLKGTLIKVDPPLYLEHTVFPVGSGIEDKPENYLTTIYQLDFQSSKTVLKVTHRGFLSVENGEKRYVHTQLIWGTIMSGIKEVAEGD